MASLSAQADLIAYWSFDDAPGSTTLADTSGSTTVHDAAYQGGGSGLTFGVPGVIGTAGQLQGTSNDQFEVALSSLNGASGLTIAGWFQRTGAGGYKGIFTSNTVDLNLLPGNTLQSNSYFAVAHVNSNAQLDIRIDNNNAGTQSALQVDDNEWHHFVSSWDGVTGAHKVWLNGVLFDGGTKDQASIADGGLWILGQDRTQSGRNFPGLLDDWGVWDEALTEAEALKIYNDGLRGCALVGIPGDTDCDGISDSVELSGAANAFDASGNFVGAGNGGAPTDPNNFDSDGDGIPDGEEVSGALNPYIGGVLDNVPAGGPYTNHDATNPNAASTDGDSMSDAFEIAAQLDPNSTAGDSGDSRS